MRPVIGITCAQNANEDWFYLRNTYVKAIVEAGGQPILLPAVRNLELVPQYNQLIHGLLLSGGGDIDPAFFGELPHSGLGEICPERDAFEITLTRLALEGDQPILGICRGIQVIVIADGGTVYQDLTSERPGSILHQQKAPRYHPIHQVKLVEGTQLWRIFGQVMLTVNSFHHQAVKEIPGEFIISATAPDGVIEGVESTRHRFVLGVQWHPEAMWEQYPLFLRLFIALVEAARQGRKVRQNS
ncbi:MAG: gamma-glutamyl-gamma-aminobutyrate hydrolase family protein [Firmicutes bacterium]|nr:gamma-glutamyl-gamma-aminobutyrate hydrolase family protein [Bacillota bacterium]